MYNEPKPSSILDANSVLMFQYRDSEQVVIDDRMEKENLRSQLEKEQLEREATTKVTIKHT